MFKRISSKMRDRNRAFDGDINAVASDVFNLAQGFSGQIAFAAIRAGNDWNIFNNQKTFFLTVTSGNVNYPRSFFTAIIANYFFSLYS